MKALILTLITAFSMIMFTPQLAMAQGIPAEDRNQACAAFSASGTCQDGSETSFSDVWENIINVATFAVGLVSVLLILIGGLRYVLSSGDPQATAGAKNTIIYAIVGLIIAIVARSIVVFVLTRL